MIKRLILTLIILGINIPVAISAEENENKLKKVREERPLSIGVSSGFVPFLTIFGDYVVSTDTSFGINLSSSIIFNNINAHYRHYFFDKSNPYGDFYLESRLGFGFSQPLAYSQQQQPFINALQYIGYEFRTKEGFLINYAIGANLFIMERLSGTLSASFELGMGYAF